MQICTSQMEQEVMTMAEVLGKQLPSTRLINLVGICGKGVFFALCLSMKQHRFIIRTRHPVFLGPLTDSYMLLIKCYSCSLIFCALSDLSHFYHNLTGVFIWCVQNDGALNIRSSYDGDRGQS